jgi:hypothetical protein
MNATIYYTARIDPDENEALFNELREFEFKAHGYGDDDFTISADEFERFYTTEATVEVDAETREDVLNTLWREWNAGSGEESDEFQLLWCEDCSEEFEAGPQQEANVNEHQREYPDHSLTGHRSMKVGDIIEVDGQAFMCASFGWEELDFEPSKIAT